MATNMLFTKTTIFLLLLTICRAKGEIKGQLDDINANSDSNQDATIANKFEHDKHPADNSDVARNHRNGIQNTIQSVQRYKCHSCEPPDCRNSTESVIVCQNALQCWKSRVRDAYGVETVSRGCTVDHEQIPFYCHGSQRSSNKTWHSLKQKRDTSGQYNIECCYGDYCNDGDFPELPPLITDDHDATRIDSTQNSLLLLAAILGPIFIISMLAFAVIVLMRRTHQKRLLSSRNKHEPDTYYAGEELLRATSAGDSTLREYMQYSMTSGSGGGLPLLIQRTLSKQVTLLNCIGKGRYGGVWRGKWHGEQVAVKIFSSRDEESWKRETEIYSTILLPHVNILGYIGSDMTSHNTSTQLWVLTHYHPLGSLYDHLHRLALSHHDMASICLSIANGLVHLHTEIFGRECKPAIAHRDLKSKNILVREDGKCQYQCVIADFGLAVMHTQSSGKLDVGTNPRVGTKRYMSPEILEQSINLNCFESLRRADIYSFGLIMWEVCRRTISGGRADEYKIPYYDMVPSDPSFEDMRKVVVLDNYRPSIPNQWSSDNLLDGMAKLIRECWHQNPNVRPTALRIKKTLQKLASSASDVKLSYDGEIYV